MPEDVQELIRKEFRERHLPRPQYQSQLTFSAAKSSGSRSEIQTETNAIRVLSDTIFSNSAKYTGEEATLPVEHMNVVTDQSTQ